MPAYSAVLGELGRRGRVREPFLEQLHELLGALAALEDRHFRRGKRTTCT